jgi:hypothetical protein
LGRLAKEGALPPPLAALEVALMTTALSEKLERYVKTRLKPDIVDFSGPPGEIYEIKSRRSAPDAVLQVCGYLHAYKLVADPRKHPLRLGTRYRPPRYIPLGEKHFAMPYTREQLPGLILYNVYLKPDSRRRALRRAAAGAAEFRERALFGLLLLLAAGLLVFIGFGLVALAAGGGGAAAGAGGATVIPITAVTAAEASAAAGTAKAAGVIFGVMQVQRLTNPNDAALKAVSDAAAQPVY